MINESVASSDVVEDTGFFGKLKMSGWVFYGIFCLLLFTLAKMPDARIKNLINGYISNYLATKGISFKAAESSLSFFFGATYKMKDVTLIFPPPDAPAKIEKISVSPSLTSLIFGKYAGSFVVENAGGKISGSFSVKKSDIAVDFKAKNMDLGKLGLIPALAEFKASGILDGTGSVNGDYDTPSTFEGDIDLNLKKVVIDAQAVMGFPIPRMAISEGKIEAELDKAKASIKTLTLGKTGNAADDIQANVTGDITLGKRWDGSTLNLKAKLGLSDSVKKSFSLIDALLGAGKQPDGTYYYNVSGPVLSPTPTPIK